MTSDMLNPRALAMLACMAVSAPACAVTASGSRPLLDAVLAGDERKVEMLIAAGQNPNHDPEGNCLLFAAVYANHPAIAELLIKKGANPECRGMRSGTALHHALELGRAEMTVKLIALGADVNAAPGADALGHSALHVAIFNNERNVPGFGAGVIDSLLRAGANPNARSDSGLTPLGLAVKASALDVIDLLLKTGADPNLAHGSGSAAMTPLELAVLFGRSRDIVLRLLVAGADARTERVPGQLLRTARQNSPNVVQLLQEHGAVEGPSP